jgi:hypothetical protein
MSCGVIGNISLFESVRVACQRHRLQVQSLTGQLGGKQSPGSCPCNPPISYSCSPTEEAIALEAMRWRFKSSQEYQNRDVIQRTEALVWDQGVAGSNPVIPTILISKIFLGSLAERICSRLLSELIQIQPLGDPPSGC